MQKRGGEKEKEELNGIKIERERDRKKIQHLSWGLEKKEKEKKVDMAHFLFWMVLQLKTSQQKKKKSETKKDPPGKGEKREQQIHSSIRLVKER